MTIVLNDPIWWSTIESNLVYSYFHGSLCSRMMFMPDSDSNRCSCMSRCHSIWLGWAWWYSSKKLLTSSSYSLALTFGQEVCRFPYRSIYLTKKAFLVWTGMGKQSPKFEDLQCRIHPGQRKRCSLMTVLYISVCDLLCVHVLLTSDYYRCAMLAY